MSSWPLPLMIYLALLVTGQVVAGPIVRRLLSVLTRRAASRTTGCAGGASRSGGRFLRRNSRLRADLLSVRDSLSQLSDRVQHVEDRWARHIQERESAHASLSIPKQPEWHTLVLHRARPYPTMIRYSITGRDRHYCHELRMSYEVMRVYVDLEAWTIRFENNNDNLGEYPMGPGGQWNAVDIGSWDPKMGPNLIHYQLRGNK